MKAVLSFAAMTVLLATAAAVGQTPIDQVPASSAQVQLGKEAVLLADGPGKNMQALPAVAFGGGSYLAVWSEGVAIEGGRARIMAARVSPDGKVLDPNAIEVAPNAQPDSPQTYPRVAFASPAGNPQGGVFLVVWQDFRNGKDYDVFGARITPAGKLLDANPIRIAAAGGTQAMPDVATDGSSFLVAFQSHPAGPAQAAYKSVVVPVASNGTAGAQVDSTNQPHPRLAWDGTSYLVVSGGVHHVFAGRIQARLHGPDGKAKGNPFIFSSSGHAPMLSIAGQPGKGWYVTKQRVYPDFWGWAGPPAQLSYFVTSEGKPAPDFPKEIGYPKANVLQPGWLDVLDDTASTAPYGPSACVWDGQHVVVVWQRFHKLKPEGFYVPLTNSDLVIGRVDGWKPIDGRGMLVANSSAEEQSPALACESPGKFLCVYTRGGSDGRVQVVGRTVRIQ